MADSPRHPSLVRALIEWWRARLRHHSLIATTKEFLSELWDFVLESTPERRRQRYGDVEFDWDHRVDTTSATVGFRDRLLGVFHSAYQPTEPAPFREMIDQLPINYHEFTFVDLGCGKGRTLLMASDYPFRRIIGVELLPALCEVAKGNVAKYASDRQQCSNFDLVCGDARNYSFPQQPLVVYLFHPFPEPVLAEVLKNLEASLRQQPRPAYLIYYNPVLEHVLTDRSGWQRTTRTEHCAIYVTAA